MSFKVSHLEALESEAIYVIREVVAEFNKPALLFSGGKDSAVLLHLAKVATWPAKMPFSVLHVDTGHNFPEVISFRDKITVAQGLNLVVAKVEESIAKGTVKIPPNENSRNKYQGITLLEAIEENGFDALLGGARRDEDKARAKERFFSHRDEFGQWQPRHQRPEVWDIYNTYHFPGEHFRVFPMSNWTELDVWQYIKERNIELPSIYFAHRREVVRRGGLLMAVTPITPKLEGEEAHILSVRYRTVGDATCTACVESTAKSVEEVIAETQASRISERGATRVDDKFSETSMEDRKLEGYF